MKVLFISPHYPEEMQDFTRGLAEVGAQVYGVGDTPRGSLPAKVQRHIRDYLQVPGLFQEDDALAPHRRRGAQAAGRPRRVPVGAVHRAGRARARSAGAARDAARTWRSGSATSRS
jgi:hypothetical protein